MAQITFTSRSYFNAAREHLGTASRHNEHAEYFSAHFFAGVAVESILRALSSKGGEPFDRSHNIEYWARKAQLLPNGAEEQQEVFRAGLSEINLRWRANQRYFTLKMLDSYLESTKLDKIRGDHVKYSSNRMLDLANAVVSLGVSRWNNKY